MPCSRSLLPLLLAGLLLVPACQRGDPPEVAQEPVMDTTNDDPMDGMPASVLVEKAEAIPPEVAAERGLIPDTALTNDDDGDPGRDSVPGAEPPPPPGMPAESTGIRIPRP